MQLNKPKFSKINWVAGGAFIASGLVAFGVVPEAYQEVVSQALGFGVFPLIMVLRTWFTGPKED